MKVRQCALLVCALAPSWAPAQNSPDEQARRLLEDGRAYRAQGKTKQALDSFETIVSGFQSTDSVDDALLEIGRYRLEVEGNVEKGREAFDQVAKRFPQSDGAPGAYYYLGRLALERATTAAELEDAIAQFTRVERLYSRSEWVPRALHATGLALRKSGKLPEAVEAQRRVALEYPSSEAAAAAQFQIGHCVALLGEPRQAMEEYQQVRNRFPESEWAPRALDRITGLYRLYGGSKPAFSLDAAYNIGAGDVLKDVRALLMTPERVLWIASDKSKNAVSYDAAGKPGPSFSALNLQGLGWAPRGELIVTAERAVRIGKDVKALAIPSDKPGEPEPLERLTAALVLPSGQLLVADEKRHRIYRFDAQGQYQGLFGENRDRQIARLVLDGEGVIVALDRDERTIRSYDDAGKPLRTLAARGTGYELKRPVDVALDPARNLYVADEAGAVYVFGSQGQLLTTLTEAKKPQALTLEPSGGLLVYDGATQRILRLK